MQKQAGELFTNRIEHGEDGLPIYSVTMDDGMVKRSSLDRKFDDIAESGGNKKVHKNDIAYNMMRMWQGAFGVAVEDCMVSPAYVVLAPQEGVSSDFFGRLMKTPCLLRSLTSQSHGLTKDRLRLYYKDFAQIALPLPSPAEQQKIAECLSSVDELMAGQARKVDAIKTHKKGLMQQLFPREGETQPRLRFPEFQNAGEWVEVALGDIAEIKLGKMLDKQKHTTGRLLPYLNNISVRWNEVNTSNLPQMYFNDNELDRFGLRAGDVVVCEGGEPGRAAVWDGRLPVLKFQKAIHRVRFNVPFQPRLLVLHLENLAGRTQFEMLFTGGGIRHLTRETFALLKIPLTSPAEQQRIADCLTSLDDLIAAETQKLDALKTTRKG